MLLGHHTNMDNMLWGQTSTLWTKEEGGGRMKKERTSTIIKQENLQSFLEWNENPVSRSQHVHFTFLHHAQTFKAGINSVVFFFNREMGTEADKMAGTITSTEQLMDTTRI